MQLESNKWQKIDFSEIPNIAFDRVCFLDSYTSNEMAHDILGFEWDAEAKTSINDNDNISAIIFIMNNTVVGYCESPFSLDSFFIPDSMCITDKNPILKSKSKTRFFSPRITIINK
jgi:hypothetical protein